MMPAVTSLCLSFKLLSPLPRWPCLIILGWTLAISCGDMLQADVAMPTVRGRRYGEIPTAPDSPIASVSSLTYERSLFSVN